MAVLNDGMLTKWQNSYDDVKDGLSTGGLFKGNVCYMVEVCRNIS